MACDHDATDMWVPFGIKSHRRGCSLEGLISVKLTREAQAGGDTQHDDGNEVVEITIHWCQEFEGPEADIIERLVVNAESLV